MMTLEEVDPFIGDWVRMSDGREGRVVGGAIYPDGRRTVEVNWRPIWPNPDAVYVECHEDQAVVLELGDTVPLKFRHGRRSWRQRELFTLLWDLMYRQARDRYGVTWSYMMTTFLRITAGRADPTLVMRLALMACEQVRKMAEVAYDVPMEERYANR